jgi:prepilin-type N-terminal cleavage/methylation domain-containing protein
MVRETEDYMPKRRGMTLVEIIVVIGIILLVVGMIVPGAHALWRAVISLKNSVNPHH